MSIQNTLAYLNTSLTAYHAAAHSRQLLEKAGFQPLSLTEDWQLANGGRYVLSTEDGTTIAFVLPEKAWQGFHIIGTHNDSPALRLKPQPEIRRDGCTLLNIEVYGGPILSTWFDRALSIAGIIYTKGTDWAHPKQHLVTLPQTVTIPSLAIHMKREAGDINPQKELLVLWGDESAPTIQSTLAEILHIKEEDILSSELYLVAQEAATLFGAQNEYYRAPRIDNLANAIAATLAIKDCQPTTHAALFMSYHHEEIGSHTQFGATSPALLGLLEKIQRAYDGRTFIPTDSLILSCDQAHAAHPNYPEKCDPVLRPRLNGGPVLKTAASHSYATTAKGAAMFKMLCEEAHIPHQTFVNRADMRGGSTIGPLAEVATNIPAIDVGCAMLAMHAIVETAGAKDQLQMQQLMEAFLNN